MIFDLPGHREELPLNLEAVIARHSSKVAGEFESIPLRQRVFSFRDSLITCVKKYDAPPWVFTAVYLTFGMLVLLTLWFTPVRRPAFRYSRR